MQRSLMKLSFRKRRCCNTCLYSDNTLTQLASQSLTVWGERCTREPQASLEATSTSFLRGARIKRQKVSWVVRSDGRNLLLSFSSPSPPQTSSKEYTAFSGRNVPITFNCTFQRIYQLLHCHLLARGQRVKGGDLKCAL